MVYESHTSWWDRHYVRFVKSFFIIGNQHLILILLRCYNWDYVKNCFYASQLTWERFISISMFDWINIEWTMNVLPRNRRMFWHGWYLLQSTLSNINYTGLANFVDICEDGYHYNRYSFMKKYVVVSPHIYSIEYVLFLYEFSRVLLLHVLCSTCCRSNLTTPMP
jgi:hypothetical protein